jgi:heme exporter protein D
MNVTFQFADLQAFLWMNGHGPFVWVCYGVTFAGLALLVLEPIFQRKRFIKQQNLARVRGQAVNERGKQ